MSKLLYDFLFAGHVPEHHDNLYISLEQTCKQPATDYETIREKASCQKRDVERALTRFVARTGETQSFFLTEDLTYFPRNTCLLLNLNF